MNERERNAADDWIPDNMPDPEEYSFEDTEEAGSAEHYFFLRYRDSATVVYKVVVTDGRRMDGFAVVLKSDPALRQTEASVAQLDLSAAFRRLEEVIPSPAGERKSLDLRRLLKAWRFLLLRICGVRSDLSTTDFPLEEVDLFSKILRPRYTWSYRWNVRLLEEVDLFFVSRGAGQAQANGNQDR